MLTGTTSLVVCAVPCFVLIGTGGLPPVVVGILVAVFHALANVMLDVLLVELFPGQSRVR